MEKEGEIQGSNQKPERKYEINTNQIEDFLSFIYNDPGCKTKYKITSLQEKIAKSGDKWRGNEPLVKDIKTFLKDHFDLWIQKKKKANDSDAVKYYQEKYEKLLSELK